MPAESDRPDRERLLAAERHLQAEARPAPLCPRPAAESEPACAMCGGPWRDLGHCKGVCLCCGFLQSCVDTL